MLEVSTPRVRTVHSQLQWNVVNPESSNVVAIRSVVGLWVATTRRSISIINCHPSPTPVAKNRSPLTPEESLCGWSIVDRFVFKAYVIWMTIMFGIFDSERKLVNVLSCFFLSLLTICHLNAVRSRGTTMHMILWYSLYYIASLMLYAWHVYLLLLTVLRYT